MRAGRRPNTGSMEQPSRLSVVRSFILIGMLASCTGLVGCGGANLFVGGTPTPTPTTTPTRTPTGTPPPTQTVGAQRSL